MRRSIRYLVALLMVGIGILHFVRPEGFVKIVPSWLPAPLALVFVSGAFEILGGLGLLVSRVRRLASYGLVALFVAVFPANVNMAIHEIQPTGGHIPPAVMWLRLPFQLVFIALALWVGRDEPIAKSSAAPTNAAAA
jgi:uncharacterized membrane protein